MFFRGVTDLNEGSGVADVWQGEVFSPSFAG